VRLPLFAMTLFLSVNLFAQVDPDLERAHQYYASKPTAVIRNDYVKYSKQWLSLLRQQRALKYERDHETLRADIPEKQRKIEELAQQIFFLAKTYRAVSYVADIYIRDEEKDLAIKGHFTALKEVW